MLTEEPGLAHYAKDRDNIYQSTHAKRPRNNILAKVIGRRNETDSIRN